MTGAGTPEDPLTLDGPPALEESQILHVIVGHGLPVLFTNTIASFRAVCPDAELLVIDNRSPQEALRRQLRHTAESDEHLQLILRDANELMDPKVGALYEAYRVAFSVAREQGFRFLHLLQGDMQAMWWDHDVRRKLAEIFERHPRCVNIHTRAFSTDRTLMKDLVVDESGDVTVPKYGMTDTGIVHLARWEHFGMEFARSEEETAGHALERGLEVVVCPWPTEIAVPWPAVIRRGRQIGREVRTSKPYLCRPLGDSAIAQIKTARYPVPWEEMCVPWGWSCLAPMSETDLSKWYYLNYRRKDILERGWRAGSPRWITQGLDHLWQLPLAPHRPPLIPLFVRPLPSLLGELVLRLRARRKS